LCMTCYQYRRRTGGDRPEATIIAGNVRRFEAAVVAKRVREATLRAERDEARRLERG
jgi:hypothetical protein